IFIELLYARLASVAAHLVPPKRHCRIHGLITVDPDGTGPDGPGQAMCLADIARPDAAAEPEIRRIGPLCDLFDVGERDGGNDWPKNLLSGNTHIVPYISKDGGRHKIARCQCPFGQTLPTHNGPGAFLLANGQIPCDTFKLLLRDQWP